MITFCLTHLQVYLNISFGIHPDDQTDSGYKDFVSAIDVSLTVASVFAFGTLMVCGTDATIYDSATHVFLSFYCPGDDLELIPDNNTCGELQYVSIISKT